MEPNEFFGLNSEADYDDNIERNMSLDFSPESGSPNQGFVADEEEFDPMLNFHNPDFRTRIRMYLKPKEASICLELFLLLLDTTLAIAYIGSQFAYLLEGNYLNEQDKVIQLLISFGVTGAIFCYCVADASRFLRTWPDRILYFVSCMLQKPILLPILLPGGCFKSYVATKHFDKS